MTKPQLIHLSDQIAFSMFSPRRAHGRLIWLSQMRGAQRRSSVAHMENTTDRYLAYMLRLWRVDGESALWRASLEDARTGQRYGFANLDLLYQFITQQVSRNAEAGSAATKPNPDKL
jgi:hypothetical protein